MRPKQNRRRRRHLGLEILESRTLLAANPLPLPQVISPQNSLLANAALVDDGFENNDTLQTAHNLGLISGVRIHERLVLADSGDFYRFNTAATSRAQHHVEVLFNHSQGDIDLVLYNSQLQPIATAASTTNNERISLNNQPGGFYWLRVFGKNGATNPRYSLKIFAAATPDDAYEENDSRATAYNLGTLTTQRTINNLKMVDSQDWFSFTTTAPGRDVDYAQITFQHAQGDLNFELYNAAGTRLSISQTTGNRERVSLEGLPAGTYFVRVAGLRGAINFAYTLFVTAPIPPPPVTSNFNIGLQMTGFSPGQQAIFQQAARRWEEVIIGDVPSVVHQGVTIDDITITAAAVSIDGAGRVLGRAGPTHTRSGSRLPFFGMMEFDTADMAAMEQSGRLYHVILHEMGHVLGIGTLWQAKGLLTGFGTENPLFIGPQATAQFNAIFGRNDPGVVVESHGGPGTAFAHWDEDLFTNELMTGYIGFSGTAPLSRITVASLADLGYTVNMAAADPFTPSLVAAAITNVLVLPGASSSSGLAGNLLLNDESHSPVSQMFASATVPLSVPAPPWPGNTSGRSLEPEESQERDLELEAILDLLLT